MEVINSDYQLDKIFVGIGCDVNQLLAAEVLKFSILSNDSENITASYLNDHPLWSEVVKSNLEQRTPFSLQRFLCAKSVLDYDYKIGIYLDSDMITLKSLRELEAKFIHSKKDISIISVKKEWNRRQQSSVLIFNQEGARKLWSSYKKYFRQDISYDELVYLKTINDIGNIDYSWNCLEYTDQNTALIHYTDMDTQPWLRNGNSNAGIWYSYLWSYIQNKENEMIFLNEIKLKNVRPSLITIKNFGPSVSVFPISLRLKDINFVPKHRFNNLFGNVLRKFVPVLLRLVLEASFLKANGNPNIR